MRGILLRSIGALLALLVVSAAHAAIIPLILVSETDFNVIDSVPSPLFADISGSTAAWELNTNTGVVTANGNYQAKFQLDSGNPGQLFTRNIVDLAIGGGAAATATEYNCIEGTFGAAIFESLCGTYSYGANLFDESTLTYTGTAVTRTIGGDDVPTSGSGMAIGFPQSLDQHNFMLTTVSGTTVTLTNVQSPGITMTFSTVPVPPAFWLFGSALGLLGWIRRNKAS